MQAEFTMVLVGECMVMRPFGARREPGFARVLDIIKRSDLAYGHLETNLGGYHEVDYPVKAGEVGSYLLSDPAIAGDLRNAGIDIMSVAANHCMDYGEPGMLATMKHLGNAGIAFAGIGRDLEEAREPGYFDSPIGRVALVSVSSGNKPHETAGLPKGTMRGRPGVNPLRARTRYVVRKEDAQALRRIWGELGVLQASGLRKEGSLRRNLRDDEFSFYTPDGQSALVTTAFAEGDGTRIETACDPRDLAGNLRSVGEAAAMAELVIVAHHVSICEGRRGDEPPAFAREFAHAAIDAGADMYIGHGWHKTLGIEIYRGKPIFYGMGNFFAQTEFIRRAPADGYEAWGHDLDRLTTLTPAAEPLHPGLDAGNLTWWSSAVIELDLVRGHCEQIRLHPVELGRRVSEKADLMRPIGKSSHALTDGVPMLAEGEDAAAVLGRYRNVSKRYGTEVAIRDGVGHVAVVKTA